MQNKEIEYDDSWAMNVETDIITSIMYVVTIKTGATETTITSLTSPSKIIKKYNACMREIYFPGCLRLNTATALTCLKDSLQTGGEFLSFFVFKG
jgi:hypothetical protein